MGSMRQVPIHCFQHLAVRHKLEPTKDNHTGATTRIAAAEKSLAYAIVSNGKRTIRTRMAGVFSASSLAPNQSNMAAATKGMATIWTSPMKGDSRLHSH